MSSICVCILLMLAVVPASAFVAPIPAFANPARAGAQEKRQKTPDGKGLRRATFQVTHASCVSCLRDIERTIRLTSGVKDVEVGIRSPHNSIVIYNAGETSLDTMFAPIRKRGYDFVNISEVSASGKNAVIVRKEQKPPSGVDDLLNGE